jgi:hypothetical protein
VKLGLKTLKAVKEKEMGLEMTVKSAKAVAV